MLALGVLHLTHVYILTEFFLYNGMFGLRFITVYTLLIMNRTNAIVNCFQANSFRNFNLANSHLHLLVLILTRKLTKRSGNAKKSQKMSFIALLQRICSLSHWGDYLARCFEVRFVLFHLFDSFMFIL